MTNAEQGARGEAEQTQSSSEGKDSPAPPLLSTFTLSLNGSNEAEPNKSNCLTQNMPQDFKSGKIQQSWDHHNMSKHQSQVLLWCTHLKSRRKNFRWRMGDTGLDLSPWFQTIFGLQLWMAKTQIKTSHSSHHTGGFCPRAQLNGFRCPAQVPSGVSPPVTSAGQIN